VIHFLRPFAFAQMQPLVINYKPNN